MGGGSCVLTVEKIWDRMQSFPIEYKVKRRRRLMPEIVIPERTSFGDRSDYAVICRLAAEYDDIFRIFKRCRDYVNVLEHVSKEQGQQYLDIIRRQGKEMLEYFSKFQENDKVGSPKRFDFGVGKFSPTTLRYVKVASDLKKIFGPLDHFKVVEIGAGYGGQCKIISDIFALQSYTIIDLAFTLPLTRKYLDRLKVRNTLFLNPQQVNDQEDYDLVVSNYAFSECVKKMQDVYIENVLSRAKRGYLTCNYDSPSSPTTPYRRRELCDILSKKHAISILEEEPRTGSNNYIVIWDDTKKQG